MRNLRFLLLHPGWLHIDSLSQNAEISCEGSHGIEPLTTKKQQLNTGWRMVILALLGCLDFSSLLFSSILFS